jgi:hypothetical protein
MALQDQLLVFQDAQRMQEVSNTMEKWRDDRKRTDVTGRWKGWDNDGLGKVEYRGKIYYCNVLSAKTIPADTPVNLRRTETGNWAIW